MKISAHVTRINSQVTGQNRVGSWAYDLTRALSNAARPRACTDTVAATRMEAMRIFESTIRVCPRQTLADKDLMSKSDMGLRALNSQLHSLIVPSLRSRRQKVKRHREYQIHHQHQHPDEPRRSPTVRDQRRGHRGNEYHHYCTRPELQVHRRGAEHITKEDQHRG